jgi:hypothetical protein
MPFIKRASDGSIVAASREPLAGLDEEISEEELAASGFPGDSAAGRSLAESDLELVRVIEDLLELLVQKGIILFTELPDSAQRKVLARQQLRSQLLESLDLLSDD